MKYLFPAEIVRGVIEPQPHYNSLLVDVLHSEHMRMLGTRDHDSRLASEIYNRGKHLV